MALTTNIVAYYKLDDLTDSVASFDLTNNNTVSFVTGLIDDAASTSTGNSNKTLDISNDLGIDGGNITISLWVKMNAEISSSVQGFAEQGGSTSYTNYCIAYDYNGGTRQIRLNRQEQLAANNYLTKTATLGTSNWHHIVLTYDGTDLEGYHNGTSFGTLACSGNGSGSVTDHFILFNNPSGGTWFASAIIDEVGVWSRAITSTEVTELYNSGNGLQYPFTSDVTVTPTTLALSLSDESPTIVLNGSWGTPQALTLSLKAPTLIGPVPPTPSTWKVGTGTKSSRYVKTKWPITEGLILGTTKTTGRQVNLTPTRNSIISSKQRKGL